MLNNTSEGNKFLKKENVGYVMGQRMTFKRDSAILYQAVGKFYKGGM